MLARITAARSLPRARPFPGSDMWVPGAWCQMALNECEDFEVEMGLPTPSAARTAIERRTSKLTGFGPAWICFEPHWLRVRERELCPG